MTSGLRPGLAVATGLSLLGALTALAITVRQRRPAAEPEPGEGSIAA